MKRIFILSFLTLLSVLSYAQAPQKFSFQAVVRNSTNEIIANTAIGVRISILQSNENGSIIYQEVFSPNPTTNFNGLLTLQIGGGIVMQGSLAAIDWSSGAYYIKSEFDTSGGTNYSIVGTSQLLSVPYALYSARSATSTLPQGANEGDILYWNGSAWVVLDAGTERQTLTICNGELKWAPFLPTVTTNTSVTNIAQFTATVSGNVSNDGCGNVTRGICYSTSPNPTISNSIVAAGQGTGNFSANLTNLNAATQYYARSYATNGAGTAYGNQINFTTSNIILPTITLDSASFEPLYSDTINIFSFIQTLRGSILNSGGQIQDTGFVWANSPNPDLTDNVIYSEYGDGLGGVYANNYISFYDWNYGNNNMPIIYPNTTYYVRAFATNSAGTAYSNQLVIQSGGEIIGSTGPAGGKIIFDKGNYVNGWRYLEVANADVSNAASWGCTNTYVNTYEDLGYGLSNTNEIITNCISSGIAAALCENYNLNGYNDWFLPSWTELANLYYAANYLPTIPNLNGTYWSSTSYDYFNYTTAMSLLANGTNSIIDYSSPRTNAYKVRPMRRF
jgi:hypothetical protein